MKLTIKATNITGYPQSEAELSRVLRILGESSWHPSGLITENTHVHFLKTVNPHFTRIRGGLKHHELRLDDRLYREGDILVLQEYIKTQDLYTGRYGVVIVSNILRDFPGLSDGWVDMSFHRIGTHDMLLNGELQEAIAHAD